MRTNRLTTSIVGTALAEGTLGAALVGAGAANADSVDDTFVATLAQARIPQIKPELEIVSGHAVCQNLSEGATPGQLIAAFNAKKVFRDAPAKRGDDRRLDDGLLPAIPQLVA
jgi:hypothetical protein